MNGEVSHSSPGKICVPHRATGGSLHDFPNLPAWIVKSVGGSTVHWAGASLRFEEHEFKIKTVYSDIAGANCSTGQSRSRRWSPGTPKLSSRWGRRAPTAFQGCRVATTSKLWKPAHASSATRKSTPAGCQSTVKGRAMAAAHASRSASAFKDASPEQKWSTLYTEIPKGRGATRQSRGSAKQHGGADRTRRPAAG